MNKSEIMHEGFLVESTQNLHVIIPNLMNHCLACDGFGGTTKEVTPHCV